MLPGHPAQAAQLLQLQQQLLSLTAACLQQQQHQKQDHQQHQQQQGSKGHGREVCRLLLQEELSINPRVPLPDTASEPPQQHSVGDRAAPHALRQLDFEPGALHAPGTVRLQPFWQPRQPPSQQQGPVPHKQPPQPPVATAGPEEEEEENDEDNDSNWSASGAHDAGAEGGRRALLQFLLRKAVRLRCHRLLHNMLAAWKQVSLHRGAYASEHMHVSQWPLGSRRAYVGAPACVCVDAGSRAWAHVEHFDLGHVRGRSTLAPLG